MAFLPLESGGLGDNLVRRLAGAINLGLLNDGEQLPSEAELAVQMGVSTLTLRGALASLREQGLVETRRGRNGGSFVRRPANPSPATLRARLAEVTVTDLRDLCDEHVAVAGATARLAAQRASESNLTRLSTLARQLGEVTALGECSRADSRFHIELAVAAQSERLTRAEISLQSEIGELLWCPGDHPPDRREVAAEHRQIVAAVAAEDEIAARDLAEAHVERGVRRVIDLRLRAESV
jgi:GntR family transcriptional regulator, transcriptional repressor for pyruvate dehydrogenase complex